MRIPGTGRPPEAEQPSDPEAEAAAIMGAVAVLLDRAGGALVFTPDEHEEVLSRYPAGLVIGSREGSIHLYLARERGEVLEQ